MTAPIRVLLVDDHPAILAGLRVILGHAPDVEIAGEATALAEAEMLIEAACPDVIVLDYELGNDAGTALLAALATVEIRPAITTTQSDDTRQMAFIRRFDPGQRTSDGSVRRGLPGRAPAPCRSRTDATSMRSPPR